MDLVLKSKEGEQNFLGQYKGQLAQDWYMLIRLYEKDSLYRAEYAKSL